MKAYRYLPIILALALTACGTADESVPQETAAPHSVQQAETADGESTSDKPPKTTSLTDLNTFTADTVSGETVSEELFADYDVTMINIWSTTCPPCIAEMPVLASIRTRLPENVQLITWCLDGDVNKDTAASVLDDAKFDGVTLISAGGDLTTLYGQLMYTPTTIYVDSAGNIIGEEIIGAPANPESDYVKGFNDSLTAIGREVIQ